MTDILEKSFLVDTNILVYLLDEESEFHLNVVKFFEWTEEKSHSLVVAHQNILELINTLVVDYKIGLKDASDKAKKLLGAKEFRIIFPTMTTLNSFFSLVQKVPKNIFDLYLAATALDNGVETIVTNNPEDYRKIKDLNVFGLEELT